MKKRAVVGERCARCSMSSAASTSKMADEQIGKKRSRSIDVSEDEFGVGELHESKSAKVHGVMTSLSPIKASTSGKTKYFHGELTDGQNRVRFVGFDTKMHQRLSDFHETKKPVLLSHCEVKQGKYSSDLEVVVRCSSEVEHSPSKIEVLPSMFNVIDDFVTIDQISELVNYQRVSVLIKVVIEEEPVNVKKGLVKQDYVIADATACTKVVTWEDNVGILQVGGSYKLSGMMVRTFKGTKYLSIPKDGFKIEEIDDIGVVDDGTSELEREKSLHNASIIGVKYFENFSGCYSCSGKVTPRSSVIGHCSRCGTLQQLERCTQKASAKVDIAYGDDAVTLSVFSPVIDDICGGSATIESLLTCQPFDLVYSDRDVILSISR